MRSGREAVCLRAMRTALHGLVALCLLGLSGLSVATTLYRWVDAQGVVHYSDTPHEGAQVIQISGAQTYHGNSSAPPPGGTAPPPASKKSLPYASCAITSPTPDSSLYAPESVAVSVAVSPGLQEGDQLTVQVDGRQLQSGTEGGQNFAIQEPERGDHSISAQVRSPEGLLLCNAPPVTFSVTRPSVNSPNNPVKPH
jgi:Domain of unknown function (DUF4124)